MVFNAGINMIVNESGEIDEDGVQVACGQIYNYYFYLIGESKIGEYIGSEGGWNAKAAVFGEGIIVRRSYAESAMASQMYSMWIHEIRHNAGHTHDIDGDYSEVSDQEAAEICN